MGDKGGELKQRMLLASVPSIRQSIKKIERGNTVVFTIQNLPSNSRVQKWIFEDSDGVTRVERPQTEDPTTWNTSWEGKMVTSGKIIVHASAIRPIEHTVNVVPRTGNDWSSTVTRHAEQPTSQIPDSWFKPGDHRPRCTDRNPPQEFRDLGLHFGRMEPEQTPNPIESVPSGPNRDYRFVKVLRFNFHSYAFINDLLRDPNSQFSQAQDGRIYFTIGNSPRLHPARAGGYFTIRGKQVTINNEERFIKDHNIPVYITKPRPRRPIDPGDWTMAGNNIVIVDEDEFRRRYGIGNREFVIDVEEISLQSPRIEYALLLEYTRRHEYKGDPESHRANFEKLVRALDPKKYAENLIARPGESRNLEQEIQKRLDLTDAETHDIVDEDLTRSAGNVMTIQGRIFDVNEDNNGNWKGNVWDPRRNRPFQSSP